MTKHEFYKVSRSSRVSAYVYLVSRFGVTRVKRHIEVIKATMDRRFMRILGGIGI
jgi:hypothetical protein